MNEESRSWPEAPAVPRAPRRWRRRWIAAATLAVLAQLAGFWVVSPPDRRMEDLARPLPARQSFLTGDEGGATTETWLWLMNPSILLQPSERDFSWPAWLAESPLRVEVEGFVLPQRPLPFETAVAPAVAGESPRETVGPLARLDPGPGRRWEMTEGRPVPPAVGPVPLPVQNDLRVAAGLAGWHLTGSLVWPVIRETASGVPAVVRLALGGDGQPATPPTLWESSGVPALDDAALAVVQQLRWRRTEGTTAAGIEPWSDSGSGWSWGLVEIRWGLGPPAP